MTPALFSLSFTKTDYPINEVEILPIALEHIYGLKGLPNYHRDPFDRLLIARAQVEKMPIISVDTLFDRYSVQRIWE